jgi:hypothetical protein
MAQTRRSFLASAGAASVVASLQPLLSLSSLSLGTARAVEPMTVIAIASAVVGAISAFTKSDGGLSAMLQAQNAKLNLIVSQLSSISKALSQLTQDVQDMREFLEEQFQEQPARVLVSAIEASVIDYRELFLGLRGDVDRLRQPPHRARVEEIESKIRTARTNLMASNNSRGPFVAIMAPVALGLEFTTRSILEDDPPVIRQAVLSYLDWFGELQDERIPTSTTSYMMRQKSHIDKYWAELHSIDTVKRADYKPGGPISKESNECVVLDEVEVIQGKGHKNCLEYHCVARCGTDYARELCVRYRQFTNQGPLSRLVKLFTFSSEDQSGVLLDKLIVEPKFEVRPNRAPFPSPPTCDVVKGGLQANDQGRRALLEGSAQAQIINATQKKIDHLIAKSNISKLRLSFAAAANTAVSNGRQRAKERLQRLS